MKSLAQISEKYNITRTGLNKRINKIPGFRKKYMKKDGRKWLIKDNAIKFINKAPQIVRPKHYAETNHAPTKYELEKQLKFERQKNAALINKMSSLFDKVNHIDGNIANMNKQLKKLNKPGLPDKMKKEITDIHRNTTHGRIWRLFHPSKA